MTENVTVLTEEPTPTVSRFNKRKIAKITAITAAAAGVVLVLKRKLNASTDGKLNVTVETDSSS